jgi:hypothetical protein
VLAHQDENEVRRTYNRAKYWPERVKMMQAWADLLDEFRAMGRPDAKRDSLEPSVSSKAPSRFMRTRQTRAKHPEEFRGDRASR